MTGSSIAKPSARAIPRAKPPAHPEEERIGQRYQAAQRRRSRFVRWSFLAAVVAPTAIAALYYGLWAAPRYVSETQFIVRSAEGDQLGGSPVLSGLLQAIGMSRSTDDSNAVLAYLQSRDAVAGLEAALPLRQIYGRKKADPLARFPRPFLGDSFERLYWYYGDRVTAWSDQDTGIITIQAQALNDRMEADTVRSAESAVAEAQKVVLAAQEDIDRFRNAEIVVDPTQNATAQLGTITDLSSQVDQVVAQILANQRLSPSNPTTIALKAKADALAAQIASEQKRLAGSQGAVSSKVSAYERLTLLRSLADASLAAARSALDSARTDARRQHVFVEEIVKPNLPDYSTEPQRLRSVATVFAVSLAAFAVVWLVSIGVKERTD